MIELQDWGLTEYNNALQRQRELYNSLLLEAKNRRFIEKEYLIMTEHKPVITLGRHAKKENLLIKTPQIYGNQVDVIEIERGGDITCHMPGQIVAYPIIDLKKHKLGVKAYVNVLEESVINTLREFGLEGLRLENAPGVWIYNDITKKINKICALGIKCSRFVTMHGIALNVNNDLKLFESVNPCGFVDKGVTSMSREKGEKVDIQKVKSIIINIFMSLIVSFEK